MTTENKIPNDKVDEEINIDEESAAGETMKAKSTKSEVMQKINSKLAGMSIEDLSAFLTKTLDQVGNEPTKDTSAQNKASVSQSGSSAPSPTSKVVKEDVDAIFGDEDLSEDFKNKASTLFEAAVSNRVTLEVARIEEEFEAKLEEEVHKSVDELHTQVNDYMDYVVEKWLEDNSVAIENNFRVQTTESFIEGLKNLFAENYIEVPEEKVDLISEMSNEISTLEESLEEVLSENMKLKNQVVDAQRASIFDEVAEDLVETQVEKLRSLAEGVEFSSQEEYKEKLSLIRNQYFFENNKETHSTGMIVEGDSVGSNDEPEEERIISEEMKPYYNAISSTVRK
jgi:hypothetical protein